MKEILVICFYFYSAFNLVYFLITLLDTFFNTSLNDDFLEIQYKVNNQNKAQFEAERAKVASILKEAKYQQLMKFGSGKEGAQVSFVGTDEHIEEFVIYGNKKEKGFAVVRVLGKDMNPTYIMEMMSIIKNGNMNLESLKPLQDLMK